MVIGPQERSVTFAKNVWSANHAARSRMTPDTAALIAARAPAKDALPRSLSAKGAPKKINKKQGTKVTHTVISEPITPATMGGSCPGLWYAARNPMN